LEGVGTRETIDFAQYCSGSAWGGYRTNSTKGGEGKGVMWGKEFQRGRGGAQSKRQADHQPFFARRGTEKKA